MKKCCAVAFAVLVLVSCAGKTSRDESGAGGNRVTNSRKPDTLCFERYSGLRNQDTASVSIVINGDKVSGNYSNFLYEKDSRKGIIVGRKTGNHITGMWTYMQEGMTDSIRFEFKLHQNTLLQKQASFDKHTGREILTDTASFSLRYAKINCNTINSSVKIR